MADLGQWWKLWVNALDDPDLDNLDIADFGRWAKLGTFVKAHGTSGSLRLEAPCRTLCSKLQVTDWPTLLTTIERLPGVELSTELSTPFHETVTVKKQAIKAKKRVVSSETIVMFHFRNWSKYQGDFSTSRVRKHRENETLKKRREVKDFKDFVHTHKDVPKTANEFLPTPTLQEADREVHPIRYILTRFDLAFLDKVGDRHPTFTGKDAKLTERMLKSFGVDKAARMVDAFFALEDDWIRDAGYGFGIFHSQLAKLLVRISSRVAATDPYAKFPGYPGPVKS